jgi:hypothetical protein
MIIKSSLKSLHRSFSSCVGREGILSCHDKHRNLFREESRERSLHDFKHKFHTQFPHHPILCSADLSLYITSWLAFKVTLTPKGILNWETPSFSFNEDSAVQFRDHVFLLVCLRQTLRTWHPIMSEFESCLYVVISFTYDCHCLMRECLEICLAGEDESGDDDLFRRMREWLSRFSGRALRSSWQEMKLGFCWRRISFRVTDKNEDYLWITRIFPRLIPSLTVWVEGS